MPRIGSNALKFREDRSPPSAVGLSRIRWAATPALALIAGLALLLAIPAPAGAKDSLGLYAAWGAFRDPLVPRCYAIAMARPSNLRRDYQPYATVGTWPRRGTRNQVHFRLSRKMADKPRIRLEIGGVGYELSGGGGDAWAADKRMNAAILAAMRSAKSMRVSATDASGHRFSNSWPLAGAASAMDAAAVGCARVK